MNFCQKVAYFTKKIPIGKVASYGQIASLISTPRAAIVVGQCLHHLDSRTDIPWQRVINSQGYITTTCDSHPAILQKQLLENEGVISQKKNGL